MTELLSFFAGLVVGLGTNLASWWVLAHYLVPRVEFSPHISKLPSGLEDIDSSGFRYRVAFRNAGRRGVIDVDIAVILRIDGLPGRGTANMRHVIDLPLDEIGDSRPNVVRLPPMKPGLKSMRIYRINLNACDRFRQSDDPFPELLRLRANERRLTLEDVLALGDDAWLQVSTLGYDEFSGARRLFQSKEYRIADIKEGDFETGGLEVIAAVPENES